MRFENTSYFHFSPHDTLKARLARRVSNHGTSPPSSMHARTNLVLIRPRYHPIDTFPLKEQGSPLVAPQPSWPKASQITQCRRPTLQPRATSKGPLIYVLRRHTPFDAIQ